MSLIYSMNYNYLLIFSYHIIDIWTLSICYCYEIMALFLKIIIWAYKQKIKPYLNVCQSFLQAFEYNSLKIICLFRSTHIAQKKNVWRHKKSVKCKTVSILKDVHCIISFIIIFYFFRIHIYYITNIFWCLTIKAFALMTQILM